jgi:kynurenine formamidase
MADAGIIAVAACMRIIDLTRPLAPETPVYPGDPPVRFAPHAEYAGHGYRVTDVRLGTHAGTHLDAPAHFIQGGRTVDQLPLSALTGPARVVSPGAPVPSLGEGERVLLASGWGRKWGESEYFHAFPPFPEALAEAVIAARAVLIGVETPSLHPDAEEDARLHHLLLGAGVVILENLANLELLPERVFLAALPLPLRGLDGSPCRAVAMLDLEMTP